jgi:hypothetical protein
MIIFRRFANPSSTMIVFAPCTERSGFYCLKNHCPFVVFGALRCFSVRRKNSAIISLACVVMSKKIIYESDWTMKTLVIYVHLIAACVAIGILLIQDIALAKTRGNALSPQGIEELKRAAKIISLSLSGLWISGLILVLMGYVENPATYLTNQKLWAKFTVVIILTFNGFILHRFSFPRVVSHRGISGLGHIEKTLVVLSGSTSTISWLFACYLGIARPWNHTVEYSYIMSIYLSLLLLACFTGCSAIHLIDVGRRLGRNTDQQMISDSIPTLTERVSKF